MIGGMQGHSQGDAAWHREQLGHNTELDAEFLSKRLGRVCALLGFNQPFDDHKSNAEVAGTTLHQVAWRIENLTKQRDELLAALEQFATWGRMQHKAQSKGCHGTFDMMALRDEIDLAEAAIASVKEGS